MRAADWRCWRSRSGARFQLQHPGQQRRAWGGGRRFGGLSSWASGCPSPPRGPERQAGGQALPPQWWHLDHLDLANIFNWLPLFDLILLISGLFLFKKKHSKHKEVFLIMPVNL